MDFLQSSGPSTVPTHSPLVKHAQKAKKSGIPVGVWILGGVAGFLALILFATIASQSDHGGGGANHAGGGAKHGDDATTESKTDNDGASVEEVNMQRSVMTNLERKSERYLVGYKQGTGTGTREAEGIRRVMASGAENSNSVAENVLDSSRQFYQGQRAMYERVKGKYGENDDRTQVCKGRVDGYRDAFLKVGINLE